VPHGARCALRPYATGRVGSVRRGGARGGMVAVGGEPPEISVPPPPCSPRAPRAPRRGLTWQLVAPRYNARYLPPGYVLDSGAPCAFPRDPSRADEIFFVLGWLLTGPCDRAQTEVIDHSPPRRGWARRSRRRRARCATCGTSCAAAPPAA
jgi:hypothetical protein